VGDLRNAQHFGPETFKLSTMYGAGGIVFKVGLGEIDFEVGSWAELPGDRG